MQRKRIVVSISKQKLFLYSGEDIIKSYPVSTARNGIGNVEGSFKTPLGKHRVYKKIGRNAEFGTIFKGKKATKEIAEINKSISDDLITTRVLCLEGLEKGKNKGEGIDSEQRCIWIHGTADEKSIGTPVSHGCIRMRNKDIMELFEIITEGIQIEIIP